MVIDFFLLCLPSEARVYYMFSLAHQTLHNAKHWWTLHIYGMND